MPNLQTLSVIYDTELTEICKLSNIDPTDYNFWLRHCFLVLTISLMVNQTIP